MYDHLTIRHRGELHRGRRFLREHGGKTCQTIFYRGLSRVDPAGYARFATDDEVMNAAGERLLADMVTAAAAAG